MIEMKKIGHCFGEKRVLDNINLEVKPGEILGLLGPSGAGKTTLIKIVTGQLMQSEGEAKLLGEDTRALSRKTCASLGMVVDNAGLYERLTCYDNLLLFAKIYRIPKEKIAEVLEKTGLLVLRINNDEIDKNINNILSMSVVCDIILLCSETFPKQLKKE